jgi:hypothetical protein
LDTGEIVKPKIIGEINASDIMPPTTLLTIGEPNFEINETVCLASTSPISLTAEDYPGGSGVASTAYRIYNASYDSGWVIYTEPFYLTGLSDGAYQIEVKASVEGITFIYRYVGEAILLTILIIVSIAIASTTLKHLKKHGKH